MKVLRKSAFLCAAASLAIAGCSQDADSPEEITSETTEETASETTEETAAEPAAWGYSEADGPAVWGDLSEDYATCKTGKEQSPIDLPAASDANIVQVTTNYGEGAAKIVNKGYTVQADFEAGFTMTSGENEYGLIQFHMHTPSENTVAGKSYPLTAHFVHANEAGELAVLGILFEEGDANAQLQSMLDNLDGSADIDAAAMLPSSLDVYNFAGSLTTPPCSEGVNWHVATNAVTASKEQIAKLNELMGNNARPVQPINDRKI